MLSSEPSSDLANHRLLCLSNGHGEDTIAVRILQALQQHPNAPELAALPLVGEGRAYRQRGIPVIGPVKTMPSGGFIYMDSRQLAQDIQGGLLQLTLKQFQTIRDWTKQGGSILAVGDIVPLLLAWLSSAPYAFVGTAKSEYYLRDDTGKQHPNTRWHILENLSGSIYHPWERWLMSHARCKAVFPRDSLTTQRLQRWKIPAFDLGNPMMDGLEPKVAISSKLGERGVYTAQPNRSLTLAELPANSVTIVLLPGSRPPEAYQNWQQILQAVNGLPEAFPERSLILLAAIAPGLELVQLQQALTQEGWQLRTIQDLQSSNLQNFPDPTSCWFSRGRMTLGITQQAFADCLHQADCAIAMAGTATEQFVGLGKPAVIFPGQGPQFTDAFAEAQTRLLGPSVTLVPEPTDVAAAIQDLLQDPERLSRIAENGYRRMGTPGAAERIAQCLIECLVEG